MIGKIIKWGIRIVVILIIFAILPRSFLEKLKPFLNLNNLWQILKTGFNNLIQFIKETLGIDFKQSVLKLNNGLSYNFSFLFKEILGINFDFFWSETKNFLANLFEKLATFWK